MAVTVSRGKRRGGPWYGEFRRRLAFERGVRGSYADIVGQIGSHRGLAGYVYRLTVDVPTYGSRRLTVVCPRGSPMNPRVFADGQFLGRHRFSDGSLCMWYWRDPPDRRWVFDDGLLNLIVHAAIHLFKEAWFVETGEWLGDEILHDERRKAS